jgi:hypothetical protein
VNEKIVKWLNSLHACGEAVEWAREQKSPAQAWRDCQRGDWMLWLVGKLSGKSGSAKRRPLVLAACECARLVLNYVPKGEDRPRRAIETAERWARGKATIEEVHAAAAAYAYAAAADAAAAAAAAAAYATAAADAAAAAAAYATAAADAAADAARSKTLALCADIVRKHYPKPPRTGGKQ